MQFNEDFLQFVWKFQLFNNQDLRSDNNEKIEILKPGTQNFGSGPDFSNAKIKINETLWAGNIEIHFSTQDWEAHKHTLDKAYDNVILHVLFKKPAYRNTTQSGRKLSSIYLENRIFENTLSKYQHLKTIQPQFIPCENILPEFESFFIFSFYDNLLTERLERKVAAIEEDLNYTNGSFDDAFMISLFKYFGAPTNKEPFEILARSFSLSNLIKQATSAEQVEALLFGLADFLQQQDDYAKKLENEYLYLKQKFKLKSFLDKSNWRFSKVRPPNFPTVRIAQLSALLFKEQRLFSYILNGEISDLKKLFQVKVSNYWQNHYNFGVASKPSKKTITPAFTNKLLINVVVPFLFYYGKLQDEETCINKAFKLLEIVKTEQNSIVTGFKKLNFPIENAGNSQSLIELKTNYCDKKLCLQCRIGYQLLN